MELLYKAELNLDNVTSGFSKEQLQDFAGNEVWKNSQYTVFVRRNMPTGVVDGSVTMTWLSIKRNDKEPCRDWRDFQWIKNQLVGEENEGVEIFPSESRLVDGSNQYHLWVFEDPTLKFPFGFFDGRNVTEHPLPGGKQRAFPDNRKPADLEEQEALVKKKLDALRQVKS